MKKKANGFLYILIIFFIILCLYPSTGYSLLWQAIPPYNVLWPLWSPILSPPNPLTGLPSPLVTSLTDSTFLPIQPALVWDPSLPYYYLLYNYIPTDGTANQLLYFDPTEGAFNPAYSFKAWPPTYLLTQTSTTTFTGTVVSIVPDPLALPTNYASLISFDPVLWLNFWIPIVNTAYQNLYGIYPGLLSSADLLPASYVFTGSFAPPAI